MAKLLASSVPGKRTGRKRPRIAKTQPIDFSDIPELADEQLRAMRRVGRPLLGKSARRLIAIRIDPRVLKEVKKEANRRDIGYQTLINDILARYLRPFLRDR